MSASWIRRYNDASLVQQRYVDARRQLDSVRGYRSSLSEVDGEGFDAALVSAPTRKTGCQNCGGVLPKMRTLRHRKPGRRNRLQRRNVRLAQKRDGWAGREDRDQTQLSGIPSRVAARTRAARCGEVDL